jgi:hypothetical protein
MVAQAAQGAITSGNGVELANYIRPHLPHRLDDKSEFIRRFARDLESAGASDQSLLYSSEFIILEPGEPLDRLLALAGKHRFTVKYVYLVRDYAGAAFSIYSQLIKRHRETKTFEEFLEVWKPKFRKTVEHAVEAVGRDNVLLFNFDQHRETLSDLFFGAILNLDFVPDGKQGVNRSLTWREAEYMRRVNALRLGNISSVISQSLISLLPEKSDPLLLTKSEVRSLEQLCGDDIAFLNSLIRGRPIQIAAECLDKRPEITLSPAERDLLQVVGVVAASTSGQRMKVKRLLKGFKGLERHVDNLVRAIVAGLR